ncbi:hypothetical protein K7X08_024002 [Anisodus acutangulus]|uniref:Heat shock protein 60 n=1 Tax=Anisodus acutangulus TaxID=402998 RepID=A0A9Q1M710_9SOLA|nr:hypothetical protein K7X08_024002 [Anisodus acutangulus]
MSKVGRKGVVTLEEGQGSENNLYVVEGMQFDRGYISPYFVTDNEKMVAEYENCKLLLVDKKITNARDLVNVLEEAIKSGYPILVIAEDIEQEPLATLVVNKLRGALKISALKAPGFGDRKSQYIDKHCYPYWRYCHPRGGWFIPGQSWKRGLRACWEGGFDKGVNNNCWQLNKTTRRKS